LLVFELHVISSCFLYLLASVEHADARQSSDSEECCSPYSLTNYKPSQLLLLLQAFSRHTDFDMCCYTGAHSCKYYSFADPRGWKAELAWLIDP